MFKWEPCTGYRTPRAPQQVSLLSGMLRALAVMSQQGSFHEKLEANTRYEYNVGFVCVTTSQHIGYSTK